MSHFLLRHGQFYVMRLWILFKPSFLAGFLIQHENLEGRTTALLLTHGDGNAASFQPLLSAKGDSLLLVHGCGHLAPCVTSTNTAVGMASFL